MQTAHAYYDGKNIQLEEQIELKQNEKLLIIRLNEDLQSASDSDIEIAALNDLSSEKDFLTEEELNYYLSIN